ncbi:MAG: hypothetical protein HZB99_03780 [Candidatus Harrisonbacteria bacterium]|nr:hypothetical protein [Candidatus Harrisonbacteria bacterium]
MEAFCGTLLMGGMMLLILLVLILKGRDRLVAVSAIAMIVVGIFSLIHSNASLQKTRGMPKEYDRKGIASTTFAVRTERSVIFCTDNVFGLPEDKHTLCFQEPLTAVRDPQKLPFAKENCGPAISWSRDELERRMGLNVYETYLSDCMGKEKNKPRQIH